MIDSVQQPNAESNHSVDRNRVCASNRLFDECLESENNCQNKMKTTKSGVHFVEDKNSFNYENNNLFYQYNQMGLGKQYVGCASKYPPDLDIENFAVGACDNNVNYLARLVNNEYVPEQVDSEQCRFVKNHDHDSDRYVGNVISNVNVRVNTERNVCTLSALDNLEFADIPLKV